MGSGVFTCSSYLNYSETLGKTYDVASGRITSGQEFRASRMDESLDPRKFKVRECLNTEEHPNTVPVILALDVTGSMGQACQETAEALGVIITNLYEKFNDIEFCIMGIGDLAYDDAPIQMSQFESDVRIAEALDKIYMEHGGGGNSYESYTSAWYMGLYRTKLDCYDKQGRKGIIITMGDEPMNPYLPVHELNEAVNGSEQGDVETNDLYHKAIEKFDIYHIAVDSSHNSYSRWKSQIESSFGQILGPNFKTCTINELADTIEACVTESVSGSPVTESASTTKVNENGEITW